MDLQDVIMVITYRAIAGMEEIASRHARQSSESKNEIL